MPQKTFTLIPPAGPGAPQTPTRPMTSKQVRKAYKASHSAPRVSRAEQMKMERAEQERIRKELEKDRAAAKARAAREKKKGKETAEREEKKRKRLPLVNVRPSQDTIARFVRKVQDEPHDRHERPDRTAANLDSILEDNEPDLPQEQAEGLIPKENETPQACQTEVIPKLEGKAVPEADWIPDDSDDVLDSQGTKASYDLDLLPDDDFLELLVQAPERPKRKLSQSEEPAQKRVRIAYEEDLGLAKETRDSKPESTPRQEAPPSTQAIMFNLDDYFPSASQQARELDELDTETPQELPEPNPISPPPPQRFFTSSGSHELMSLALHRSRRSAALEELHQKERMRTEAGILARQRPEKQGQHANVRHHPSKTTSFAKPERQVKTNPPTCPTAGVQKRADTRKGAESQSSADAQKGDTQKSADTWRAAKPGPLPNVPTLPDKENVAPVPVASQETEYGGDWVDEMAMELLI